jgi:hypothetical protein
VNEEAAEWLTLDPASGAGNGSVAVSVTENTILDPRTATVTFTAGTLTATVAVTQEGAEPTLSVDKTEVAASYAAGAHSIAVTSNMAWRVTVSEGADWLTLSTASGDGNGEVTVTLAVNAVPTGSTRTATVTFTAGTLTQTVTVTQEVILATSCPNCLWSGSTWVTGYITTNAYPFEDESVTKPLWSGGDYNTGANSDVDGRANTRAIASVKGSAVQTCKDLGAGWYLPAYEEYFNMGTGKPADWNAMKGFTTLNGESGAGLLTITGDWYSSSTESYSHDGRFPTVIEDEADAKAQAVKVAADGNALNGYKNDALFICAWQQP